MDQHKQRAYPPTLGGRRLALVTDGPLFRWRWGDELHSAHMFLEIRMWTPTVVGNKLTFIACDEGIWSLWWGHQKLDESEDIYDVQPWNGRPVYVSSRQGIWEVRVGSVVVASHTQQLSFTLENGELCVYRLTVDRVPELMSRSARGQFASLGGQR